MREQLEMMARGELGAAKAELTDAREVHGTSSTTIRTLIGGMSAALERNKGTDIRDLDVLMADAVPVIERECAEE